MGSVDNAATAYWANDEDRDDDNDNDTVNINHRLSDPILREEELDSNGTAVSCVPRNTDEHYRTGARRSHAAVRGRYRKPSKNSPRFASAAILSLKPALCLYNRVFSKTKFQFGL